MTDSMEEKVGLLVEQIRAELTSSSVGLSSDPRAVLETAPYRALIDLGEPALNVLAERLRAGDIFLNRAIMAIAHLQPGDLRLSGFVSEQELADAILKLFEPVIVRMYHSDVYAMVPAPAAPNLAPKNATFLREEGDRPITPRIYGTGRIEERAYPMTPKQTERIRQLRDWLADALIDPMTAFQLACATCELVEEPTPNGHHPNCAQAPGYCGDKCDPIAVASLKATITRLTRERDTLKDQLRTEIDVSLTLAREEKRLTRELAEAQRRYITLHDAVVAAVNLP